jgi:hypothetical protein
MSEALEAMVIGSSEVIIDSELTEGLAGEKIKVTLEGAEEAEADGAADEVDPKGLAVTAAAPMLEAEVEVMVGRLGILEKEEEEEAELVTEAEAEEAVIDILEEEEDMVEVTTGPDEVEAMEVEEGMLVMVEVEAEVEDIAGAELETSSMAIWDSSSIESDMLCRRS